MAYDNPQTGSLKRKRRRREDRPAISARLYLDSNLKGEVGVLSDDLLQDLYPILKSNGETNVYVALTPWTPNPSPSGSEWSILPFRGTAKDERQLPPSTIRFPAAASGTQSFVNVVQLLSPNRTIRQNVAVEVRVSDVIPLTLESIYVSVDTEALQKLDAVQKKYAGGFIQANGSTARKAGKRPASSPASPLEEEPTASAEGRRRQLVHDALRAVKVVHTGDTLALGLTHPVTHASARLLGCEPVSQGIVSSATKVVVVPAAEKRPVPYSGRALISPRLPEASDEEEDASEAFYSATEEKSPAKPVVISKSATDMSNSEDPFDSSAEESNLSDEDDDMISLAKPGLSDQPSGLASAIMAMTPRPFGLMTGISTPGSVFSHVTTTTIRGGHATRSRMFHTQGLLDKIPDELLHPRPAPDEDDEARVFVDSATLARLGCFSGDWVKIEPTESHFLPQLSAFGSFEGSLAQLWRPVKVYSLPESMSKRPQRYQVNPRHGRRDSISSLVTNAGAVSTIYLSPILLANLNGSDNVTLSPLPLNKRANLKRPATPRPNSVSARLPPTASEVTLRKVVTPLSNERALNNALFANLKDYFEHKQRILKAGDLIAVPIDASLGRSMYEGEAENDGLSNNEMLSKWSGEDEKEATRGGADVAWFTIEEVTAQQDETELVDGADGWGGVAAIDPTKMTMRQSGDDRRKLPPTTTSTWPYYLHVLNHSSRSTTFASGPHGIHDPPQPYVANLQRRLRELFSVSTSPRAAHLGMPPLAILLTSTQRSIGKAHVVQQTCADLGMHYFAIDAYDIVSESGTGFDTQAQGLLEARCERALDCGAEHTAICIQHLDTFNSDRVAASLNGVLESCRVLVATTTDVDKLPDSVRGLFTHEIEITAPDENEREGILRNVVNRIGLPAAQDVDLAAVAVKTAALVAGDLVDVVDRAVVARNSRLEQLAASMSESSGQAITRKDIALSGGAAATAIIPVDFEDAVDFARKNFADSIGAPKIPNVQWSDVGGLTHIKDAVIETIQLPLSRPELFAKGLKKRSGILFYGPPGTGKTLLAKAIATEFSLNFFSVKGPELLNMYIGESEANVRRVFQRARDARPCVVFFDELDSVAPKRGNQGDSGGVMDRIVSQLLAELDGMSDGEDTGGGVFVIGATNRPDLLDQALLRPGRFDKMLYLGISDTHEKQATILQALTRKYVKWRIPHNEHLLTGTTDSP
jgi:peroxin-6